MKKILAGLTVTVLALLGCAACGKTPEAPEVPPTEVVQQEEKAQVVIERDAYEEVDFEYAVAEEPEIKNLKYGEDSLKVELDFGEETSSAILRIDGKEIDLDNGFVVGKVRVIDDVIVIVTGGTDIRSTRVVVTNPEGENLLLAGDNIDSALYGMSAEDVRFEENKIIFECYRTIHGPSLITEDGWVESGTDEWNALSDDEITGAEYEIEYLGNGEFGEAKQVKVTETLGEFRKALEENE